MPTRLNSGVPKLFTTGVGFHLNPGLLNGGEEGANWGLFCDKQYYTLNGG